MDTTIMTGITTDSINTYLTEEGFQPKQFSGGNILFRYQLGVYVVAIDENDPQFLQIIMPKIFDMESSNYTKALIAANTLCASKKIVKAIVSKDSVDINTEILVNSTSNFSELIPRMLGMLQEARYDFYQLINESTERYDDN